MPSEDKHNDFSGAGINIINITVYYYYYFGHEVTTAFWKCLSSLNE